MKIMKKTILIILMLAIMGNLGLMQNVSLAASATTEATQSTPYYFKSDSPVRISIVKNMQDKLRFSFEDYAGVSYIKIEKYDAISKKYDTVLETEDKKVKTNVWGAIVAENLTQVDILASKVSEFKDKEALKEVKLRIIVKDSDSNVNINKAIYTIKRLSKSTSDGQDWVVTNNAIKINITKGKSNKVYYSTKKEALKNIIFTFKHKDNLTSIVFKDMNSDIQVEQKPNKKEVTYTLNLEKEKFVAKNGIYKIQITAKTKTSSRIIQYYGYVKDCTPVSSLKVSKTLKLYRGTNKKLQVTVSPTNAANKDVTFKSSDNKVATVDKTGNIKAIKAGTTTITVTSKENTKIKATCNVTVVESPIMNIPYLCQNDAKYASYRFPVHSGSSISLNGCGIVATTMVIQYLTNTNVTVEKVATWADNNGYFNGKGVDGTLFAAAADHWSVGKVIKTTSIEEAKQALRDKKPVISYQSAGLFTSGKHFIVLTGIDSQGKIHVNNPNGLRQGQTFEPYQIQQNNIVYYIFENYIIK